MGLNEKIPRDRKLALSSVFFVTNAFIWYFLALNTLDRIVAQINANLLLAVSIYVAHFGTFAVCLIVGALLVNKVGRRHLFIFWTLLGVVSPIGLLALNFAPAPIVLLIAVLFAASTSLGMPNCMQYFINSTNTGSRGRYAGLILLLFGVGLFSLRLVAGGIELTAFILVGWRLVGLIPVFLAKPFKEYKEKTANISYHYILRHRSFILYVIPWTMFSLVDYLTIPVQSHLLGQSTILSLQIFENVIAGVSALVAGFLMDRVGRKQAAIVGFALLGLSYSFLGLYPKEIISWYFYTVFDGITWGILTVLFVLCIWGELNQNAPTDKYYALGVLPFFISIFLQEILTNYISVNISPYTLFSFVAFFLFLAVLPLVYAPETLPEKIMKDRELKGYVEKALKQVQKETGKSRKKDSAKPDKENKEGKEEVEGTSEYEKARKLAEKYY